MEKKEMTKVQDAVTRMAIYAAQMYYHLTHEMVKDYGKEAATETILRAMHGFGVERGKNIRKKVDDLGLEPTIENMEKNYDMPIDEGWAPAYAGEDDPIKYFKTSACVYADYWIEKDWREIGRLYCEVDPAIREGYNDDIIYHCDHIILDGDDYCDGTSRYKSQEHLWKDLD